MHKASQNWPYYYKEARYYDKSTGKFYQVKGGRLVPTQNKIAAQACKEVRRNG